MTRWLSLLLLLGACSAPPPAGQDAGGEPEDAGTDAGRRDAGVALPGCTEDNTEASVIARDGFRELCVDAGTISNVQCGDGSRLKLSWRDSPDGGTALFLFFRGGGRCSDYIGCWGRDGRGGLDRTVAGLSNTARATPRVSTFGNVAQGLFNGSEPGNALAGYAAVHVPDCTGDLGARDEVVDLPRPANANFGAPASVRTHFRGARGVEAAVAVAKARYPSASRVVLGGGGEGAYFALEALPRVDAAWPGVPLTVLFDGESGVGDAALEAKVRSALAAYDGQAGRRGARFVTLSFASDPVQQAASGLGGAGFGVALEQALVSREAAAPATFRWFVPPMPCHTVAMTPGLWTKYVPWAGGLRPAQPTVRPNSDLAVDGGMLEPWLAQALGGTGAYGVGFASSGFTRVDADAGVVVAACPLPESLEY